MIYVPVNNFSVMSGQFPVYLGRTSTKHWIKCFAQGTQHGDPLGDSRCSFEPRHEISNNMVCAASKAQTSDQSLCLSLEYSMTVKLLTEQHLRFLSLTGGCTASS